MAVFNIGANHKFALFVNDLLNEVSHNWDTHKVFKLSPTISILRWDEKHRSMS